MDSSQKLEDVRFLGLLLQMVVVCLIWVLGTKLVSTEKEQTLLTTD